MITEELKDLLEKEGYFEIREIDGAGVCCLKRFMFTVGLVWGADESGYIGRWCYANLADAKDALMNWNGEKDPPGPWIKYKGIDGERCNLLIED
jgi:hypothetical protein